MLRDKPSAMDRNEGMRLAQLGTGMFAEGAGDKRVEARAVGLELAFGPFMRGPRSAGGLGRKRRKHLEHSRF
jgi:hypothetical protein